MTESEKHEEETELGFDEDEEVHRKQKNKSRKKRIEEVEEIENEGKEGRVESSGKRATLYPENHD